MVWNNHMVDLVAPESETWPTPSRAAQDLIRQAAEAALQPKVEWIEAFNAAVFVPDRVGPVVDDPVLREVTQRANMSSMLLWAGTNWERPGARVAPNLGEDVIESTRSAIRRGYEEAVLETWRTGQNAAWQIWMEICFSLTDDAALLHEVLSVTSRSMSAFTDDSIAAVADVIRTERADSSQGNHPERLAVVSRILAGSQVERAGAEVTLGYALTGSHLAVILWGSAVSGDELERASQAVMTAVGTRRRLTVLATGSSSWLWLPVTAAPRAEDLAGPLSTVPSVRVAIGRPRDDLDGFRQSHLEAVSVQRMMAALATPRQVGTYVDTQLVALLSDDVDRADTFVSDTLGELAHADVEVQTTVRVYLEEQCNAARVADRLFTHRNTIVRRLARAEELLPRPLADNPISVGAALQLLWWRGPEG